VTCDKTTGKLQTEPALLHVTALMTGQKLDERISVDEGEMVGLAMAGTWSLNLY
jgi:hypothetical protein